MVDVVVGVSGWDAAWDVTAAVGDKDGYQLKVVGCCVASVVNDEVADVSEVQLRQLLRLS